MGLFSKGRDSLITADDLSDSATPVVQPMHPSQTPARARDGVRVTAADPHGPPSQSIERRAPNVDPHASMSPSVSPVVHGTAVIPPGGPAGAPSIPPLPVTPKFGIEDALRLLRELPGRESAAVREAVQKTLEFMNVDLERLVEDASTKDMQLESRATGLQREVEQHEALALAAKKQIAAIQMERTELEAAKTWMLEHRRNADPIPLERVVRGSPVNPNDR